MVDARDIKFLGGACLNTYPVRIILEKFWSGVALLWPVGLSQVLHLHFSLFVTLDQERISIISGICPNSRTIQSQGRRSYPSSGKEGVGGVSHLFVESSSRRKNVC
mgnify:CR=1 FL=1